MDKKEQKGRVKKANDKLRKLIDQAVLINEEKKELCGYTFYKDGSVYNSKGRKLAPLIGTDNTPYMVLFFPDERGKSKKRRINLPKAMYMLFSGENIHESEVISFKDNNRLNYSYDNLFKETLKEHRKKNPYTRKKILTKEKVLEIQKKYNLSEKQKNPSYNNCYSIRKLAEEYKCSICTIQRVIHDKYFENEIKDK